MQNYKICFIDFCVIMQTIIIMNFLEFIYLNECMYVI